MVDFRAPLAPGADPKTRDRGARRRAAEYSYAPKSDLPTPARNIPRNPSFTHRPEIGRRAGRIARILGPPPVGVNDRFPGPACARGRLKKRASWALGDAQPKTPRRDPEIRPRRWARGRWLPLAPEPRMAGPGPRPREPGNFGSVFGRLPLPTCALSGWRPPAPPRS